VFQTLFVFSNLFADWVIRLLYGYVWEGEMKARAYNAEVMDFWRNNRRHKTHPIFFLAKKLYGRM
jgi:hypothetical protein